MKWFSKKANTAAVLLFVVAIVVGGTIYGAYELSYNPPQRVSFTNFFNEFKRMFNQVFVESYENLGGYFFNQSCFYFENKPRPPNSSQFLESLSLNLKELLADNVKDLDFNVDYGKVNFVIEGEYKLNDSNLVVDIQDLIVSNSEVSNSQSDKPNFTKELNGTFVIPSSIGAFYNNMLGWFDDDLDNFSKKVIEKLYGKNCWTSWCFCGEETAKDHQIETEYNVNQDKELIKEALSESANYLEIDGFNCIVSPRSEVANPSVRKKYEQGTCKTSADTIIADGGKENQVFVKKTISPPEDECGETKVFEETDEKTYLSDFTDSANKFHNSKPRASIYTLEVTYAVDVDYDLEYDIICSKDSLQITVPVRFAFEKVCELDDTVHSGNNFCLAGGDGAIIDKPICVWLCSSQELADGVNGYYFPSFEQYLSNNNIGCVKVLNSSLTENDFTTCCYARDDWGKLVDDTNNFGDYQKLWSGYPINQFFNCFNSSMFEGYDFFEIPDDSGTIVDSKAKLCCCPPEGCTLTAVDKLYNCLDYENFNLKEVHPEFQCTGEYSVAYHTLRGHSDSDSCEYSFGSNSVYKLGFGDDGYQFWGSAQSVVSGYDYSIYDYTHSYADNRKPVEVQDDNDCTGYTVAYNKSGMVCGMDTVDKDYFEKVFLCSKTDGDSCHSRTPCDYFTDNFDLSNFESPGKPDGEYCDYGDKRRLLPHNQFIDISNHDLTQFSPLAYVDFESLLSADNSDFNWENYPKGEIPTSCQPVREDNPGAGDYIPGDGEDEPDVPPPPPVACCVTTCTKNTTILLDSPLVCPGVSVHYSYYGDLHYYQHHLGELCKKDDFSSSSQQDLSGQGGQYEATVCLEQEVKKINEDNPVCKDVVCEGEGVGSGDGVCLSASDLGNVCGVSETCTMKVCDLVDGNPGCVDTKKPINQKIYDEFKDNNNKIECGGGENPCAPKTCEPTEGLFYCVETSYDDESVSGCNAEHSDLCYKQECQEGVCTIVPFNQGGECTLGKSCSGTCNDNMECIFTGGDPCSITKCGVNFQGICDNKGDCSSNGYDNCCGNNVCKNSEGGNFFTDCLGQSGTINTCCNAQEVQTNIPQESCGSSPGD